VVIACCAGRDNSLDSLLWHHYSVRYHRPLTDYSTAKRTHSRVSLLFSRIAAASLLHARLAPSREPFSHASHTSFNPSSSFRAAANTSRPHARSPRSLCLSSCRSPCRNSAAGPVVRVHMTCCRRAQEPHVATSSLPFPASRLLPALAPHQMPLTISIVMVSERCSCSSVCR
jgi:hypothetical protein